MSQRWRDPPPKGTAICAGFDGSENDDWTVIRAETYDGLQFTPRYGPDGAPTIWAPGDYADGRIPRDQVHVAWKHITSYYRLERAYCDPGFHDELSWATEIEFWATTYGEKTFIPWAMNGSGRVKPVHEMLQRFIADLTNRGIRHDGCPVTSAHMANAKKIPKLGGRYVLGKPTPAQKIDAAVTSALAHEAACDARADGWSPQPKDRRVLVFR